MEVFKELSEEEKRRLFDEIKNLATEKRNALSENIDISDVNTILNIINTEDHKVPIAVREKIPQIREITEIVIEKLKEGGRLFYVGAGTSGRLGVLDAAECPPTFGTDPETVQGIIAGGREALVKAIEGAEDFEEEGAKIFDKYKIGDKDVVIGLAASWRTPYVVGALKEAIKRKVKCALITCVPEKVVTIPVDVKVCLNVGPEVVMGSTRMKSGTAQKLVLNMITTTTMVRLGKVYKNMMVDLMATNNKLTERSKRVVMTVTGVDYDSAAKYIELSGGSVKKAIVMILADVDAEGADRVLKQADGFVRKAIELINNKR